MNKTESLLLFFIHMNRCLRLGQVMLDVAGQPCVLTRHIPCFWILLMFSFLFALSVLLLTYSLSFSVDFLFSCASVRSFLTDAGLSSSFCVRACELYIYMLMKIKNRLLAPTQFVLSTIFPESPDAIRTLTVPRGDCHWLHSSEMDVENTLRSSFSSSLCC